MVPGKMSLKDAKPYVACLLLPFFVLIPKIWNTAVIARNTAAILYHELICRRETNSRMVEWNDHSLVLNKM